MSDDSAMRQAIQQQAQHLKEEFENLEEIRSVVKPFYDPFLKHAEFRFDTPFGVLQIWHDQSQWNIRLPEGQVVYALPKTLRQTIRSTVEQLRNEAIMSVMEQQVSYLRSEFGDLEELMSWANTIYDYDHERAEVRFDTTVGLCRFWRDGPRWLIKVPDGSTLFAQPGELREKLTLVRQYLRTGII